MKPLAPFVYPDFTQELVHSTGYADVDAVLAELLAGVRGTLGPQLVGARCGGFPPRVTGRSAESARSLLREDYRLLRKYYAGYHHRLAGYFTVCCRYSLY